MNQTKFIFTVNSSNYTKIYKNYNTMRKDVKAFLLQNGYKNMNFIIFKNGEANFKGWSISKEIYCKIKEIKNN